MTRGAWRVVLGVAWIAVTSGCSDDVVVGVSWGNYQEARWGAWDEPALRGAIEEAGATYVMTDAQFSTEQQIADLDTLREQGADALVVLAQDAEALMPAVQRALDDGIPVVAYDRLIDDPDVFFLSFDNVEVGRMEARAVFEAAPTGNYVIIKGDPDDPNSDFLREGQEEILHDAIQSGAVVVVGETYTPYWDIDEAQSEMEGFLTANSNDIDGVVCANDGMAGGVVAALDAQGLAGLVPVSGQDGDGDALNRVALGVQTVSVWKDARALGQAAGAAAVALAEGTAPSDIDGAVVFDSPGGNEVPSNLLAATPITQDNLDVVIDAGWITQDEVCDGVPTGTVAACP